MHVWHFWGAVGLALDSLTCAPGFFVLGRNRRVRMLPAFGLGPFMAPQLSHGQPCGVHASKKFAWILIRSSCRLQRLNMWDGGL